MFKLQEKENGEIVLHSLFLRRNSSEYGCLYPSLSLDLLNCQVFELAQEHVACYSEWSEPFECAWKGEERIGYLGLGTKENEYMILGKLSFQELAMYRSIDESWTELEITPDSFFEGIVSFKGKFYAIDRRTGKTTVVEPTLEVNTFQRSRPCDKTRQRWVRILSFLNHLSLSLDLSFLGHKTFENGVSNALYGGNGLVCLWPRPFFFFIIRKFVFSVLSLINAIYLIPSIN